MNFISFVNFVVIVRASRLVKAKNYKERPEEVIHRSFGTDLHQATTTTNHLDIVKPPKSSPDMATSFSFSSQPIDYRQSRDVVVGWIRPQQVSERRDTVFLLV
jgi:hypothetical protein